MIAIQTDTMICVTVDIISSTPPGHKHLYIDTKESEIDTWIWTWSGRSPIL